jgi:hypothetical protein
MNNQETLTKAINQAIANGWGAESLGGADTWGGLAELEQQYVAKLMFSETGNGYWLIVFDHEFAKTLWGDDEIKLWEDTPDPDNDPYGEYTSYTALPNWQHHLQQMVIADDPIKYLGENVPDFTATENGASATSEPESQEGDTGGQTR